MRTQKTLTAENLTELGRVKLYRLVKKKNPALSTIWPDGDRDYWIQQAQKAFFPNEYKDTQVKSLPKRTKRLNKQRKQRIDRNFENIIKQHENAIQSQNEQYKEFIKEYENDFELTKKVSSNLLYHAYNGESFVLYQSTFKKTINNYISTPLLTPNTLSVEEYLNKAEKATSEVINKNIQQFHGIKVWISLELEFIKYNPDDIVTATPFIKSDIYTMFGDNFSSTYKNITQDLIIKFFNTNLPSSMYTFKSILSQRIHIAKWQPLRGSSYKKLPKYLRNKKAIINIKNDDDRCFEWCIMRSDYPVEKNAERISDLKKIKN